jgi:hypothetical protein
MSTCGVRPRTASSERELEDAVGELRVRLRLVDLLRQREAALDLAVEALVRSHPLAFLRAPSRFTSAAIETSLPSIST